MTCSTLLVLVDVAHCWCWWLGHDNFDFQGSSLLVSGSREDVGDWQIHLKSQVTSPYGNNLHHMENVTHGQFAFTTQESGNYMACFWADAKSHGNKYVTINLDWKTGIAAKDWGSIAKKEKIKRSSDEDSE